jgi:hypothetical protein
MTTNELPWALRTGIDETAALILQEFLDGVSKKAMPWLLPPWSLQRPFGMAAPWQGLPVRLEQAPHRNV